MSDSEPKKHIAGEAEWRNETHRLLSALPENYEQCRAKLVEICGQFGDDVAKAFQTRLNERLQSMPQDSYAEKRALASFVNHELHQLGLAIKCPKTGNPAILIADTKNGQDGDASRFRLEFRNDLGRKCRTWTSTRLFDLELMDGQPRKEGLERWTKWTEGGRKT